MRLKEFKAAFANFDVTYYRDGQEWVRKSTQVQSAKDKWIFPIQTIADQELFITFDMISQRIFPAGCKVEGARDFNILLRNMNGEVIAQEPVSKKTGYGLIHKKNLSAGNYQLVVVNFGNVSALADFAVSTYSEQGVEILEQKDQLASVIERAQIASPSDVITTKLHETVELNKSRSLSQQVIGRSFLDDTQQVLYIGLTRKHLGSMFEK